MFCTDYTPSSAPEYTVPDTSTVGDTRDAQFKISLRLPASILLSAVLFAVLQPVWAQAPVNDVVSWPSGLLLLASVLYAALGTAPDQLWEIEPSVGFFMWCGLPIVSIPTMQKVNWVANACHFVPGIRTAYGQSNFWVRSEEVSGEARSSVLRRVLSVFRFALPEPISHGDIDEKLWRITSAGLLEPTKSGVLVPLSPELKSIDTLPSARDILLFAAIDYHVFREWEVRVESKGTVVFSTKGMIPSAIIDVTSEEAALPVVAANLVRRPHSQTSLRSHARLLGDSEEGPYVVNLDNLRRDTPVCNVDFHSYSPEPSKVSATLQELAGAYYRVVRYIKANQSDSVIGDLCTSQVLRISVGQCLWIAILGGAILDTGRLTIQNLPGRWAMKGLSADEAFVSRIESIVESLKQYANKPAFFDLVYSGGISRRPAIPFLIVGLFGQIIICYFLSVGTSAGVWTSVALANSLYAGRLTDWHSLYYGKTLRSEEPGMKMRVPGSERKLMAIATFDRSTPREGVLRPGFLLNLFGLLAAILGAIFTSQTRAALGFGSSQPTRDWVVYTAIVLSVGCSVLVGATVVLQQIREKTWNDASEIPTRWLIYATIPSSLVVASLGVLFQVKRSAGWTRYWPVLDAITWLSGLPLGMPENGRIISADDNMLHLALVNRWLMGAIASSIGSTRLR